QKDKDYLGLSELLAERSLVLRHLSDETGDKNFLEIALAEMIASVKIARQSSNPEALALPLFNLAKIQEDLEQNHEAVENYREALTNLENNPPTPHGIRPAMVADFKVHLAICEYKQSLRSGDLKAGDKLALELAEQALAELESAEEQKYEKDVWVSGGHMRIANILKQDDPEKAKEHLQKAKEIIDDNPDLKLRLKQWEKLAASF
ncbi:MAG: Uncharacterized protein G01um101493_291, partial [Microgenomates group bacterium Gr01-1014_93]